MALDKVADDRGTRRTMEERDCRRIGRAIAARLIREGWNVVNFDLTPPEVEADLGDRWVEVDLGDVQSTRRALGEAIGDRPVGALVNTAAIGRMSALEDTGVEDFDLSVAVNMRASVLCAQAVIPGMKQQGFGRIVRTFNRLGQRSGPSRDRWFSRAKPRLKVSSAP